MADSVCARPHGGSRTSGTSPIGANNAILARTALARTNTAGRLAAVAWPSRGSSGVVQLLLMTQKKIASCEATRTFGTLEWLLLGVGALMALQVFQSSEGPLTSRADMRSGFVRLGRREIRCLGIDSDCRRS
jgi:hypothetical protein